MLFLHVTNILFGPEIESASEQRAAHVSLMSRTTGTATANKGYSVKHLTV